ncbi:MAG: hypothetical protein ACRDL7_00105 [Gaiellaceae bacterium]
MTREEGIRYLLERVKENEPIFILRGRDLLAEDTVLHWARLAKAKKVNESKVEQAFVCAAVMLAYRPQRMPD